MLTRMIVAQLTPTGPLTVSVVPHFPMPMVRVSQVADPHPVGLGVSLVCLTRYPSCVDIMSTPASPLGTSRS